MESSKTLELQFGQVGAHSLMQPGVQAAMGRQACAAEAAEITNSLAQAGFFNELVKIDSVTVMRASAGAEPKSRLDLVPEMIERVFDKLMDLRKTTPAGESDGGGS